MKYFYPAFGKINFVKKNSFLLAAAVAIISQTCTSILLAQEITKTIPTYP